MKAVATVIGFATSLSVGLWMLIPATETPEVDANPPALSAERDEGELDRGAPESEGEPAEEIAIDSIDVVSLEILRIFDQSWNDNAVLGEDAVSMPQQNSTRTEE